MLSQNSKSNSLVPISYTIIKVSAWIVCTGSLSCWCVGGVEDLQELSVKCKIYEKSFRGEEILNSRSTFLIFIGALNDKTGRDHC